MRRIAVVAVVALAMVRAAAAGAHAGQQCPGALRSRRAAAAPAPAPRAAPGAAPGAEAPHLAPLRGGGEDPMKKHEMSLMSRCAGRRRPRPARCLPPRGAPPCGVCGRLLFGATGTRDRRGAGVAERRAC